jgi:hypothetical protein
VDLLPGMEHFILPTNYIELPTKKVGIKDLGEIKDKTKREWPNLRDSQNKFPQFISVLYYQKRGNSVPSFFIILVPFFGKIFSEKITFWQIE